MNLKTTILLVLLALLCLNVSPTSTVSSFEELAQVHCRTFPIELLYRLSTGQLSEIYGQDFQDIDCYVRQFVNKDGQDTFQEEDQEDEDEEEDEEGEEQSQESREEEVVPDIDPLVQEYAPGLKQCLPEGADPVEAVYAMWRFYRFVLQHDYALEWMRAKVRSNLGYESEKPNAWMDGEQSEARLRLDKLFSNQFYDYVDQLMFRDFLHPVITFFKKNLVFAASGAITESGKPILIQYIETKNTMDKIFEPVTFRHPKGDIFAYTVPGIPLLLAGSSGKVSWAFTGVLIDRSNVEQIETLGSKFFHQGSETWIKLENVTLPIKVKGEEPFQCKYVHSTYGTLYEKHKSLDGGKVSEYIARWHEKEKKVRVVFSELMELVLNEGQTSKDLEFPFNSLVLTNRSGIFQHLCYQKHPSYFLYPDLTGAPENPSGRWVSTFKRNFLVVSNTHLTSKNQGSYLKKDIMNPTEEQFLIETRRKMAASRDKLTVEGLFDFVTGVSTDPLVKKRKELLIHIYRKAKFLFFPEEGLRKECDQIVALLEKWDNNLDSPAITPAFVLWDYFFRDYTFNFVSSNPIGGAIAKHKAITEVYWTNQVEHWKVGTSYGECDSDEWNLNYRDRLNGTGENSTCFFNIMRGINRTREILRSQHGGTIKEPKLADFLAPKVQDLRQGYLGSHLDEAFANYYSRNLAFGAGIGDPKVIYLEGHQQERKQLDLSAKRAGAGERAVEADQGRAELDTEL